MRLRVRGFPATEAVILKATCSAGRLAQAHREYGAKLRRATAEWQSGAARRPLASADHNTDQVFDERDRDKPCADGKGPYFVQGRGGIDDRVARGRP